MKMNNKKPRDPLYPDAFKKTSELKRNFSKDNTPAKADEEDDLSLLKSFNHKLGVYLNPKSTDVTENEKRKRIGVIITTIIIITLIISGYYFIIYEPFQEDLSHAKTTKLNELHELYKGPMASASNAIQLEDKINNAESPEELEMINIIGSATKDWKEFHKKSININKDKYGRTMAIYLNEKKTVIMPVDDALHLINENDVQTLSNMKFEIPNTVSVPVLISRMQAGAGLINVGSLVDLYTMNNYSNGSSNNTNPDISGCTVLAIMRYEESSEIDSEYSKSNMRVNGNDTNPQENTKSFSSNVLEILKGSIINGYDEGETLNLLTQYGAKLSDYERQINLGDLDAEYMLLIEVPQDKVNYVLDNMGNIVLTIPTNDAPEWMEGKLNLTSR